MIFYLFKKIFFTLDNKKWLLLIIFSFVFFFINIFLKGYFTNNIYTSGDEPHYMMMTDSLVQDGDFNLRNDYLENRAQGRYSKESVFPHVSATIDTNKTDRWFSIHTIGLPLLMYAPYKLFGLAGARLLITAIQVSSIFLFYIVLKKYLKNDKKVFLGILLIMSCTFFWQNLGALLPDLISVTFGLVFIILFGSKKLVTNIFLSALLFLGVLIHTKMALILLPLYLGHNIVLIKKLGYREFIHLQMPCLAGLIILFASYAVFLNNQYGFYSPSGLYGSNGQLFGANPFTNLIAILFDRVKGLIFYYPVLFIVVPYLHFAIKDLYVESKKASLKNFSTDLALVFSLTAGTVILFITQISFSDWSGSFAPSGRYMLVPIFIIAFLVAKYFSGKNRLELVLLGTTLVASILISIGMIYRINVYREMGFVYLGPGVDSIITQRFIMLQKLPLFELVSAKSSLGQLQRGALLMLLYAILSLILIKYFGSNKSKLSKKAHN